MKRKWNHAHPDRRRVWIMSVGLIAAFAVRSAWSQRAVPVTDLLPVSSTLATQRGCRDDPTELAGSSRSG